MAPRRSGSAGPRELDHQADDRAAEQRQEAAPREAEEDAAEHHRQGVAHPRHPSIEEQIPRGAGPIVAPSAAPAARTRVPTPPIATEAVIPIQEQARPEAQAQVHVEGEMIPVDERAEDRAVRRYAPVDGVARGAEELDHPQMGQERPVGQGDETQASQTGGRGDVRAHDREEQEDRQEPEQQRLRGTGIEADRRPGGRIDDRHLLAEGRTSGSEGRNWSYIRAVAGERRASRSRGRDVSCHMPPMYRAARHNTTGHFVQRSRHSRSIRAAQRASNAATPAKRTNSKSGSTAPKAQGDRATRARTMASMPPCSRRTAV